MDGHVKVWWFDKIDQADPPDDDRVILVDPTYDFYTPGVKLMSIEKRKPGDSGDTWWYAQDGNGGIWLIDLNTEEEPKPAVQLYRCHGGKIKGLAACPWGPYLASLGELGSFFLYNYITKSIVLSYTFPATGTCLIWLPIKVVETGEILLGGFGDGQVRVCCLNIPEDLPSEEGFIKLNVSQVVKPHNKSLVTMSVNPQGNLLVTAGEDFNIFLFRINPDSHSNFLVPIGFFPTSDVVTYITWHPTSENVVLLGCLHGQMMQIQLPVQEQPYTGVSFKLELDAQCNTFTSYKSQIKRDIKLREIEERKAKKRAKKMEEMEKIKKENPGLEIDEEVFLADSESEEELEPLYFPDVPNRIIWLKYTVNDTIWLSMAGYDAGYIYEYHIDQKDPAPVNFKLLDGAENTEVSTFVYTSNQEYLIFAMEDGSIRVNKVNPSDYTDLSDYFTIAMHDNQNGFVPKLSFSYDEKYLFSCGYDGNIFAYKFNPKDHTYPQFYPRSYRDHICPPIQDTETYQKLSLEEVKIKAEDDRVQKLANEHKNKIREVLKTLKDRYKKLLIRNSKLLESQVIPRQELEPDERVAEYVNQIFAGKVEIVRRKLAFDVEKSRILVEKLLDYFTNPCDRHPIRLNGINKPGCDLLTVRQRKMPDIFYEMFDVIAQKMKEEEGKGRPPERAQAAQKPAVMRIEKSQSPLEFFLLSLTPEDIEFRLGPKLNRLLDKYRNRRVKWEQRAREWEEFLAKKPIPGKNHPEDEKFLAEAKTSFGDYKLKEHKDYKVSLEERETTVKHYKKLLETRAKQYNLRHQFTETVMNLRQLKYEVIDKLREKQRTIQLINEELPEELRKNGPPVPEYDPEEFPEEKLQVKVILPESEGDLDDTSYKSIFVDEPTGNTLQRQIIMSKTYPNLVDGSFQTAIPNEKVLSMAEMTFEELLDCPEKQDTPFEACLKANRLTKLLCNQKQEISEMQGMIDGFNNRIYEARKDRLPVLIKGYFVDIYVVCLNEELRILKSCEEEEDKLSNNVNAKLKDVHNMEDYFDSLKMDRENQETKLENLKVDESKIQDKFKSAVENNKFYDFLKKVFKKKFKPPKIKTDDESSSSSSSSSEDSDDYEDDGSIDSRDFGFIKQDLNVCPKGCEPALFNFTIELRSKRHEVEQSEKEEQRVLEQTKKDMGLTLRKLEILKRSYGLALNELEEFRRDKQDKLNHVRCTVVLNLDQIYGNLRNQDIDISDFLVFSKTKLADLYKRVKQLHGDSLNEQGKHDTYLKHLMRMRKDIVYMQRKSHCLTRDIKRLLKIKFGKEVDINELEMAVLQRSFQKNMVNELEEVVLKKLVYELRIKMADVRGMYIHALERWQRKIVSSQHELAKEIKENTRRLELLAVIRKEKKDLVKFVETQEKRIEKVEQMEIIHKEFTKDLQKLQLIIEEQNSKLQELKEEITILKTKGMAQEVRSYSARRKSHEKEKSKKDEREQKWIDYDDYVSQSEDEEKEEEMSENEALEPEENYYFSESEDLVRNLIENLLKNVNADLLKKSTENMVDSILKNIMKCVSIRDIVNEIVDNLPVKDLSEEQLSSVEETASKLMYLQEPQVNDENVIACVKDILEETLSEVLCKDPNYLIPKMLEKLVDNLPLELLSTDPVLDEIALSIKSSTEGIQLDKDELQKSLEQLPLEAREDVMVILKEILQRVYDTGIDFIYIINQFDA